MISLYSGTPGSGKSLHMAMRLYWWVRAGKPCISNFKINLDTIPGKKQKNFTFLPNNELTPKYLIDYANNIIKEKGRVREGSILLVIDEAQLLFNARDWAKKDRGDWLSFFTLHRHLGYDIVLIAQFDGMLDKQIRSLVEYEYIHRKVSNYGWKGKIISFLALGNLFVCVKVWYPMSERVGSEFYKAKKKYYSIYDTYEIFEG